MNKLFEYENYRIICEDGINLQIQELRPVTNKTTKETTEQWKFVGFYSNIKQALKGIMHHMGLSVPRIESYLSRIADFEAKIDSLEIKGVS